MILEAKPETLIQHPGRPQENVDRLCRATGKDAEQMKRRRYQNVT